MMILVMGGVCSGKSCYVEVLIGDVLQVLYIVILQIFDDEMVVRIQYYKDGRLVYWWIVECWWYFDMLIIVDFVFDDVILLECIIIMVMNLLFVLGGENDFEQWDYVVMECVIDDEIQILIVVCQCCLVKVVLVINEVGMGIVLENCLVCYFCDIVGWVN